MAAIDDLNAAVAILQTDQAAAVTAINDLVAKVAALEAASNDPAITAATANITAVSDALKAAASNDPGPAA